jgi:hypothetical protein
MPTIKWIGKNKVVNKIKEVLFHLLSYDPMCPVGEDGGIMGVPS